MSADRPNTTANVVFLAHLIRPHALICALLLSLATVTAQAAPPMKFQEGVHYATLDQPIAVAPTDGATEQTSDQSTVLEVFSYHCIHCFQFDRPLHNFIETMNKAEGTEAGSAKVALLRSPALFSVYWQPGAKAYYAAQILGVSDDVHSALFASIHMDRKPLTDEHITSIFEQFGGIAPERTLEVLNSPDVDQAIRGAMALTRDAKVNGQAGVRGVPALIINGQYLVTGNMAGSNAGMLEIAQWLLETAE